MCLQVRRSVPAVIAPVAELFWVFAVPFLYELAAGAILATILQLAVRAIMTLDRHPSAKLRQILSVALAITGLICIVALIQPKWSSAAERPEWNSASHSTP